MRVDANISVARAGERGTKAEVKNMNSLRSVFRALVYEEKRQTELIAKGAPVEQSTRHWDEKASVTKPLRSKEEAFDYRYFPEPDLVPIEPSVEWLRQLREEIPELPTQRRQRLGEQAGTASAAVLTSSKVIADFYEDTVSAARVANSKQVANLFVNDLLGLLGEKSLAETRTTPAHLALLADLITGGDISKSQGNEVLAEVLISGRRPSEIIEERGISQVSDTAEIEAAVDKAIAENAEVADRIRSGEDKPFGFMVGQVMKATGGRGNPAMINDLLRKRLRS